MTVVSGEENQGKTQRAIQVKYLGLQEYQAVWEKMQTFTNERDDNTEDQVWLVEHPPVFTQGQAGKAEHLLKPGDIPVVKTDRGGQVTYHGPGQLVAYPLLNLKRLKMGVRDLVTLIENSVIQLLEIYGIQSAAKSDAPGVYVDGKKIASLGLRVRKGCSFHGVAINIDMDLTPFLAINPCGYPGLEMTQISEYANTVASELNIESVAKQYTKILSGLLGLKIVER